MPRTSSKAESFCSTWRLGRRWPRSAAWARREAFCGSSHRHIHKEEGMRQRTVFSIALAVAALLALAAPVFAGGWSVVTLDTLPREVRAGQTLHLGFMVRQHGIEPNSQVSPTLTAIKQAAAGS